MPLYTLLSEIVSPRHAMSHATCSLQPIDVRPAHHLVLDRTGAAATPVARRRLPAGARRPTCPPSRSPKSGLQPWTPCLSSRIGGRDHPGLVFSRVRIEHGSRQEEARKAAPLAEEAGGSSGSETSSVTTGSGLPPKFGVQLRRPSGAYKQQQIRRRGPCWRSGCSSRGRRAASRRWGRCGA
jgi:hypothetical protein